MFLLRSIIILNTPLIGSYVAHLRLSKYMLIKSVLHNLATEFGSFKNPTNLDPSYKRDLNRSWTKPLPDKIPPAHFCTGGHNPSHVFCNGAIIPPCPPPPPHSFLQGGQKSLLQIFQLGQNHSRLKLPIS